MMYEAQKSGSLREIHMNPFIYRQIPPDDSSADDVYRLRYNVYCIKEKFLSPECYPSGRETDAHDARSLQLGMYTPDGNIIGCSRVVPFHPDLKMPVHEHCTFYPECGDLHDPNHPWMKNGAEISRTITNDARVTSVPKINNLEKLIPKAVLEEIKKYKNILFGSFCAVLGMQRFCYHVAKRQGFDYTFFAIENRFARLIAMCGIEWKPIGPVVDYYGPVRPYMVDIDNFEKSLYNNRRPLFWYFMNGLERKFWPSLARKDMYGQFYFAANKTIVENLYTPHLLREDVVH